ncbi:hypothetical protein JCM11641_005766 [Rhodosporidiobolus odoratus]
MELDDPPTASTSRLPAQSPSNGVKVEDHVKSDASPAPAPDRKGKRKAEDSDDDTAPSARKLKHEQDVEQESEETRDPEEEIMLASVPKANLVGLKYAGGIRSLKQGMKLELRRDPQNISDKSAIEVRHPHGQRIGYMSKGLAGNLAPMVKERKIRLEGTAGEVPAATVGLLSISMSVEIWGKRKYKSDPRLDWLFNARREAKVKEEKEAKDRKAVEAEADEDEQKFQEKMKKAGTAGLARLPNPKDPLMYQALQSEKKEYKRADVFGQLYQKGANDPALLPTHPNPPGKSDGSMRVNLLEFQKQGLAWMIRMEHPQLPKKVGDAPVQMWRVLKDDEGKKFYHHLGTDVHSRKKPALERGGILADEMGLGKTMQTIALICTDDTGEDVLDEPEDPSEEFDDMTLIVCPLSVASNWTDQFHQHVGKKRLSWHLYHGEGKDISKKDLKKFDVVITTYQALTDTLEAAQGFETTDSSSSSKKKKASSKQADEDNEVPLAQHGEKKVKPKKDLLRQISWRRIVLDEGHLIKNPKAKMSRACAELIAERRWILTGTPIVNAAQDLGAMVHFLKMCQPLDDRQVWKQVVGVPGKEDPEILSAVITSTTLRRTKDMVDASGKPLIRLPEVAFYQHKVQLKPAVRELYTEVENEVKKIVEAANGSDKEEKVNSTMLLALLMRLRQLACDPTLCPADFVEDIRERKLASRIQVEHDKAAGRGRGSDQLSYLRGMLRDAEDEDCMACGNLMVEPRITICQHVFCASCIDAVVDASLPCPQCGWALKPDEIVEPAASDAGSYSRSSSVASSRHGSVSLAERTAKTEALIGLLKATPKGVKSLVFSQWTGHLDRIEAALHEEGIATCRFDGSMRQSKREEVIKLFTASNKAAVAGEKADKKNPMVMLLSLKAGALGLNLTVASQVFLMDPWWQPAIEQQAIDRVNRIGQTKDVRVFQIVAEDTVEARVLDIQAKKEALIAEAFSGSKNTTKAKEKLESKLDDLAAIFGL